MCVRGEGGRNVERAEQTENEKPTNGGKVDKRQKRSTYQVFPMVLFPLFSAKR